MAGAVRSSDQLLDVDECPLDLVGGPVAGGRLRSVGRIVEDDQIEARMGQGPRHLGQALDLTPRAAARTPTPDLGHDQLLAAAGEKVGPEERLQGFGQVRTVRLDHDLVAFRAVARGERLQSSGLEVERCGEHDRQSSFRGRMAGRQRARTPDLRQADAARIGRVAERGRFQRPLAEQKVHHLSVIGQGRTRLSASRIGLAKLSTSPADGRTRS